MKLSDFRRGILGIKKTEKQKDLIQIFCYCLMPNHFHLLLKQLEEKGVSDFLRKVTNSYTRYFNTKYDRIGPLFQGAFKAKLVETDEYLLQLSKYIHRNPFPLSMWEGKVYPYSSYSYYLSGEKHSFCDTEFITSNFSKQNKNLTYRSFVEEQEFSDPAIHAMTIDFEEH